MSPPMVSPEIVDSARTYAETYRVPLASVLETPSSVAYEEIMALVHIRRITRGLPVVRLVWGPLAIKSPNLARY